MTTRQWGMVLMIVSAVGWMDCAVANAATSGPLNARDFGAKAGADSTAALQRMIDTALASPDGIRDCMLPPGTFYLSRPLRITNAIHGVPVTRGFKLSGSGKMATTLAPLSTNGVLVTDGFEYALVENLRFVGSVGNTGAVVLVAANSRAGNLVQGNTFRDIWVEGRGASRGIQLNHDSQIFGGDVASTMGSENLFLNIHINGCTNAGVQINGYNALQNTFIGGNISQCPNFGICVNGGSFHAYSVGTQNGLNNTFDFQVFNGTMDGNSVEDCRSESLHFISGGQGPLHIKNCSVTPGVGGWGANTAYTVGTLVQPTVNLYGFRSNSLAFRCVTSGTSSNTEPPWPATSVYCSWNCGTNFETVIDGTVVWQVANDASVIPSGSRETVIDGLNLNFGRVLCTGKPVTVIGGWFSRDDWLDPVPWSDKVLIINPTTTSGAYPQRGIFGAVDGVAISTNLHVRGAASFGSIKAGNQGTATTISRTGDLTVGGAFAAAKSAHISGNINSDSNIIAAVAFQVKATTGLTTNINVICAGHVTNQLQFTGGILTGVVPQ